jgi:hypothetical protein
MCTRQDFVLPDLPPGCLKCGRMKPVNFKLVQYRCTGSNALTQAPLAAGVAV